MKFPISFYIVITTIFLVLTTAFATLNFAYAWVFYLSVIGQISLLIMVYKVLKDNYTTTKTFKDFYEDHPIKEENYR